MGSDSILTTTLWNRFCHHYSHFTDQDIAPELCQLPKITYLECRKPGYQPKQAPEASHCFKLPFDMQAFKIPNTTAFRMIPTGWKYSILITQWRLSLCTKQTSKNSSSLEEKLRVCDRNPIYKTFLRHHNVQLRQEVLFQCNRFSQMWKRQLIKILLVNHLSLQLQEHLVGSQTQVLSLVKLSNLLNNQIDIYFEEKVTLSDLKGDHKKTSHLVWWPQWKQHNFNSTHFVSKDLIWTQHHSHIS